MVAEARVRDGRPMGEGKHVRFTVESGGARARAVAFGGGGGLPVQEGVPAEATFTLEVNEWGGVSEPRLVLRHAAAVEDPIVAHSLHGEPAQPANPEPVEQPAQVQEEEQELVLFALP
jgi:hypothetical protein